TTTSGAPSTRQPPSVTRTAFDAVSPAVFWAVSRTKYCVNTRSPMLLIEFGTARVPDAVPSGLVTSRVVASVLVNSEQPGARNGASERGSGVAPVNVSERPITKNTPVFGGAW